MTVAAAAAPTTYIHVRCFFIYMYMHALKSEEYQKEEEEEENNKNTLILVDCRLNMILRRQWTVLRLCYCSFSFLHIRAAAAWFMISVNQSERGWRREWEERLVSYCVCCWVKWGIRKKRTLEYIEWNENKEKKKTKRSSRGSMRLSMMIVP